MLAYEVIAPLFFLNPVLEEWSMRHRPATAGQRRATLRSLAATVAVMGVAFVYKSAVSSRVGFGPDAYGPYLLWMSSSAVVTNFVDLGWYLPAKVAAVLRQYPDRVSLPLTGFLGVCIVGGLLNAARTSPVAAITRATWRTTGAAGLLLFAAGYSTFLVTSQVYFSATGMSNRSAIASAIGLALAAIGAWGALVSRLPTRLRAVAFALGVAALGVSGSLLTGTVASFWGEASVEQQRLIAQLRSDVPALPPYSTLLLDGVCPYRGPGTVFETDWDVSGMLQLY